MDIKILLTVFARVFIAELGDKTQDEEVLQYLAGTGFLLIGAYTIYSA